MRRLAEAVVGRRKWILAAAMVALILAGAIGGGVAGSLSNGGFQDPESESVAGADLLSDEFGTTPPAMILVVGAETSVDDPEIAAAAIALTGRLATEDAVTAVSSYWHLGSPPSLRSDDGRQALVFVSIEGEQGEVLNRSRELKATYGGTQGGLEVLAGGPGPLFSEVQETTESDLVRAESIAFPITLVLLIIVFGSVVAALLPLGVGVFAIISTFFVLQMLTELTEVSIFALNLTTAMGLGLAIDYALFIVSRYREEMAGGHDQYQAAIRTIQTAGRTVLFSAGTVAVSLAAMLVFPLAFLRSFGYAGIAVVALAAVGAVVVLPALLSVLGPRVEKLKVRKVRATTSETGWWHRVATNVMRYPIPIATVSIALLLFLGSPFLRIELGQSDDRVLGEGSEARVVGDVLRENFSTLEGSTINVVATSASDSGQIDQYALQISLLENVARVDGPTGSYLGGVQVAPAGPASTRFANDGGFYLSVVPGVDPGSADAEALVEDLRGMAAPTEVLVTGESAGLVDTKDSLFSALPWALAIIATVTFVVLFLMFGSVVVPLKAVVLNLLSLSATFGAMVWIFQDGNLSGLLGFTPTGRLEMTMPILMFCIAFGLSMDYEVFLLSRIKEEYDLSQDNERSVALGLERTGRIVTAAAVLISVVFISFATSGVTFMKLFGVGMTLAVLVDAFVVRTTLVPAFMRLAGGANWWAPRWMRSIYRRFRISDTVDLDRVPSPV